MPERPRRDLAKILPTHPPEEGALPESDGPRPVGSGRLLIAGSGFACVLAASLVGAFLGMRKAGGPGGGNEDDPGRGVRPAAGAVGPEGGAVVAKARGAPAPTLPAPSRLPAAPSGGAGRSPATVAWGVEEIVARCEASIAIVRGPNSAGSGFLVAPGKLATNAHVVRGIRADEIRVIFPSAPPARSGPLGADVIYLDDVRDLAILEVETDLQHLEVHARHEFRRGQEVVFIGNPVIGGVEILEMAAGRGIIGSRITLDNLEYYQLSGSVNGGNSGGPVVDMNGRVIGVVTARAAREEGIGFCVPAPELADAIRAASSGRRLASSSRSREGRVAPSRAAREADPAEAERLALKARRESEEAEASAARAAEAAAESSRLAAVRAKAKKASDFANRAADSLRIGQLLEKQRKTRPALNNYRDLVEDFPGTPSAKVAASRIAELDRPPDFSGQSPYAVARIVDGLTIVVVMAGKEEVVRLLGLEAFARREPNGANPGQVDRATSHLTDLLGGRSVFLAYEPGFARRDDRGRLLAYVYRADDRLSVNRDSISKGFLHASPHGTFSLAEEFRNAESRARLRKMGNWSP